MLPQSAAVAFVLAKVAVNGAVVECDLVVFAQVGAYLFGAEFAADKGVDVLNQLRIELIELSLALFDSLRPLQNSPKSPKCLGGNLGDFGEFCKGLNQ